MVGRTERPGSPLNDVKAGYRCQILILLCFAGAYPVTTKEPLCLPGRSCASGGKNSVPLFACCDTSILQLVWRCEILAGQFFLAVVKVEM